MGRFIMNAHLLSHGFPAINLQSKKRLVFNQLMLSFYESGDQSAMNLFMRKCLDPRVILILCESLNRKLAMCRQDLLFNSF